MIAILLRDYGETLKPAYALRDSTQDDSDWLLLIRELPDAQDFDIALPVGTRQWQASPQVRFERLLRETKVPAGLLVNRQAIHLVYAPRGESSGFLTFRIPEMIQVAGRPLFAALDMLLSSDRSLWSRRKSNSRRSSRPAQVSKRRLDPSGRAGDGRPV